ncbi:MAG TPA: hypothetical protein VK595_00920 [Vicinamibacterales bacterium]|nr:hypothetical protein [Vicinamibacterales bacterium]
MSTTTVEAPRFQHYTIDGNNVPGENAPLAVSIDAEDAQRIRTLAGQLRSANELAAKRETAEAKAKADGPLPKASELVDIPPGGPSQPQANKKG